MSVVLLTQQHWQPSSRLLLRPFPQHCSPSDLTHTHMQGSDLSQPGAVVALRCQLPRDNPYYGDTPAPAGQVTPNPLGQAEVSLSLARDPWQVLAREQQHVASAAGAAAAAAGGAAAAAGDGGNSNSNNNSAAGGPEQFVEQELVVEGEPEEGSEVQDEEVQR